MSGAEADGCQSSATIFAQTIKRLISRAVHLDNDSPAGHYPPGRQRRAGGEDRRPVQKTDVRCK